MTFGESGARLIRLPAFTDERGQLVVGEGEDALPFRVVRFFTGGHGPAGARRGAHAVSCEELLVAAVGSLTVSIHDGKAEYACRLDRRDIALLVPRYTYCWQYDFSADAVVLVLASEPYASVEYIRGLDTYRAAVTQKRIRR